MSKWLQIRIQTEPAKLQKMQSRIIGWPEEAFIKNYFQLLQNLTATAADVMRNYISDAKTSTPTGIAQGRKGRVVTGEMMRGVTSNAGGNRGAIKQPNGKYLFKFGWLDGKPGYAVFQEWGTSNGIKAMNAQRYASEWVRKELKLYEVSSKAGKAISPRSFGEGI